MPTKNVHASRLCTDQFRIAFNYRNSELISVQPIDNERFDRHGLLTSSATVYSRRVRKSTSSCFCPVLEFEDKLWQRMPNIQTLDCRFVITASVLLKMRSQYHSMHII